MSRPILTVTLKEERDIVLARQRSRQVAALLGFERQDQTRIATAVSEVARNAHVYGRGGRVELRVEGDERRETPASLMVRVIDSGPGIPDLDHVLSGSYHSPTGMGLGLIGTRRLMDGFEVQSSRSGTTVTFRKAFPRGAPVPTPARIAALVEELARQRPVGDLEEGEQQNRELLAALDELTKRQSDLERVNRELEDTNRGVVALYAELDEKAEHLRRADELKTRFLSEMSHEFRTPLNSIIAISRILQDRTDGPLTPEQATQVGLVHRAARELLELVNDLLDLARVEAGKVELHVTRFRAADLFGALRGLLRPLQIAGAVRLVIEEPGDLPDLRTDEAKVTQILRNFVSNALKFTERGEVRVSAAVRDGLGGGPSVVFSVSDTGIGIAPEHLEMIFEDFTQIDSPLQRRAKGTGLGLPLCRKLASLLGGTVSVESRPGCGSTFRLGVPVSVDHGQAATVASLSSLNPDRLPILVVEDMPSDRMACERDLAGTPFQAVSAATLAEARRALEEWKPAAIVLDIRLQEEDSWAFLAELKGNPVLAGIPVVIVTAYGERERARALGAEAYCRKPLPEGWLAEELTARLGGRVGVRPEGTARGGTP